jgi:DNA-binding NarL/FixJ family response regulator
MYAEAIEAKPIRVAIIDDTEDLRFLLRASLTRGGMDVVGEAGDGLAGIDMVTATQPDIILLDLAMPVMDGQTALPHLLAAVPGTHVIVLSGFGADMLVSQLLDSGAVGYIEKGHSLSRIATYIQDTYQGPLPISRPPGPVLRLVHSS